MKLFTNSLECIFIKRPQRFIILARTEKEIIKAHCPNPGRLLELLIPGRKIILEKNENAHRKTQYTLVAVYYRGNVISLYSARANRVARECVIPLLYPDAREVLSEQTSGSSRFDFLIQTSEKNIYLEVKACTLVENNIGMFPDAPSLRATRHVKELASLSREQGKQYEGHVLFLVTHPDCRLFMPNIHTDPDFSITLAEKENNITIHVVSIRTKEDGETGIACPDIPYTLAPVEWVRNDSGTYLLVILVDKKKEIIIGALGKITFHKGYYCYAGSALQRMQHRMKRHCKKRKKEHWHIDYLTKHACSIHPYPIYYNKRMECSIAVQLKSISDGVINGFGSSDCRCASHLFYFNNDPVQNERFISLLFAFRHYPVQTTASTG